LLQALVADRIRGLLFGLTMLAASFLPAGHLALAAEGQPKEPLNLVLISLDTTRADHLSLYGYPLATTPNLDRFARSSLVFEQARTVVPLTGPSHASVFTSLYPHRHGAFRNGVRLKEDRTTLAEILLARGYQTAAFVSGWTMRGTISGLNQGFLRYDDSFPTRYKVVNRERLAEDTVEAVRVSLDQHPLRPPFFLFVHFFDPHAPYRHHPGIRELLEIQAQALPPERREPKALAYDSELAYLDLHLGALLQMLRLRGMLEETAVLIFSDHGESLGEHGYWGHGRKVYEQTLRVPIVLHAPGWFPEGRRVRDPVTTLDLLPTLLTLLGVPRPPDLTVEGRDLALRLRTGEPLPEERLYFETFKGTLKRFTKYFARQVPEHPSYLGCVEGPFKFILQPEASLLEIYNLDADAAETQNLADRSPGRWQGTDPAPLLRSWYQEGRNRKPHRTVLSRDEIEQLKSLGYVE